MSDDEFKKLMLERFDALDGRLHRIEGRLDSVGERLTELTSRIAEVKQDTTQLKVDVRLVYRSLETVLEQQDVEINERVHLSDVANRHERWITGIAKHVNVKLSAS